MEDRTVGRPDATKDQRRATRLRQIRRRMATFSSSEKPKSRESHAADASRDRGRPKAADVTLRDADRVEELRAEARYRRERLQLYRARMYRGSARSQTRLRELQRSSEGAAARLERAELAARN
jgi:hypothetical protein